MKKERIVMGALVLGTAIAMSPSFGMATDPLQPVEEAMFVKSRCWKYEGEVRLLLHQDHHCRIIPSPSGKQFRGWPFDPNQLVRLDYGIRIPEEVQMAIESVISKKYPHVERYHAEKELGKFAIAYTPISPAE